MATSATCEKLPTDDFAGRIKRCSMAAKSQREPFLGPTTPKELDFDISIPVSAPVTAVGRVTRGQRPKVLRTVYHGPYEGLGEAWHMFGRWAQANGYKVASDLYECYVVGPESSPNPADWRTELSRPVIE